MDFFFGRIFDALCFIHWCKKNALFNSNPNLCSQKGLKMEGQHCNFTKKKFRYSRMKFLITFGTQMTIQFMEELYNFLQCSDRSWKIVIYAIIIISRQILFEKWSKIRSKSDRPIAFLIYIEIFTLKVGLLKCYNFKNYRNYHNLHLN